MHEITYNYYYFFNFIRQTKLSVSEFDFFAGKLNHVRNTVKATYEREKKKALHTQKNRSCLS